MSYAKQNFKDGNVLKAEHLNAMDEQIAKNAEHNHDDKYQPKGDYLTKETGDERYVMRDGLSESFEPAATDLPRIFFTGRFPKDKLKDGELPVTMEYISKTKRFFAYATAKVQGSSSTTFTKKNFTFKLYEDAAHTKKKNVAFRNWPAKNKFVAKANTIDRTHARNVVSARIWGDMARSRAGYDVLPEELKNSPNMGAIDGFPVKIYLNGVYQGLYTWNFGKEDWMVGLDEDNPNHMMICAEGNVKENGGVIVQDGNAQNKFNEAYTDLSHILNGWDWEVEVGEKTDTIRDNFKAFSDLVVSGSDDDFKANLHNYLDIESFIDNYIFMWLVCGVDSLGKNQFMYTYNAGLPWYSGVYDLDSTWGMNPYGTSFYAYDTVMHDGYIANNNRLYERFRALFMDDIRTRWNEVKHSALSIANIINHFEVFHDAIPVDLFAEDSAVTTANGAFVTTSDSGKGFDVVLGVDKINIQQIRNFAAARWAYVDAQINYIECTSITLSPDTLTFNEAGQVEITAILNEGCNDAIVWTSDNEEVATVGANGYGKATVTAIYNGSCTITATCGNFSAICTVTVSGLEEVFSTNLAGANGDGSALTIGKYDYRGTITENSTSLHSEFQPYKPGDVYYIYGFEHLYNAGGFAEATLYTEDERYIAYSSNATESRKLLWEDDSNGPTRTVNGHTAYCQKITLPTVTSIDGKTIAKFRFNGRTTLEGGTPCADVTGGVYIIQRNEPITEEILQKYEAMVAGGAEA